MDPSLVSSGKDAAVPIPWLSEGKSVLGFQSIEKIIILGLSN